MIPTTAYCNASRQMSKDYILSKHNNGGGVLLSDEGVSREFLKLERKQKEGRVLENL